MIANNEADLFWHEHQQGNQEIVFSDDFKNLMTAMFSLNPDLRPNIAEIRDHIWMQAAADPEAEAEEIRVEF